MPQTRKDGQLKKHSSAIHAKGSLSLLERKLSNVLLYHAYDDLLVQKTHQIPIASLAGMTGYNSNDQDGLKDSLRNLMKVSFEWDILNEDGKEWGISNLLAGVVFKDHMCTYEYSEALAEKFASPDLFGIISLEIQRNFTSGHALTIYEICSRFKGLLNKNRKECSTKWYSIDVFKQMLGVHESKHYELFKELNRKIIKPSVAEINGIGKKYAGTDIFIEPHYKRRGRAVSEICFKITANAQSPLPLEDNVVDEIRKTEFYPKLLDFGFSDKAAINLVQTYDAEYLEKHIALTENKVESGGINLSIGGFLTKSLEKDFKEPKTETDAIRNKRLAKEEKKQQEVELEKTKLASEKHSEKMSKQLRDNYISGLTKDEKKALLIDLKENNPVMRKVIKNLDSPMIATEINKIIPDFEKKLGKLIEESSVIEAELA